MPLQLRTGRVLFIDVEMTCWEDGLPPLGMRREIIEFGLVEVDVKDLRVLREGSWLVRPKNSEVSAHCTSITGIDAAMLSKDGRPLQEVLRTIAKEFGPARKPLLAWGDDWTCIEADCQASNCENPFPRDAFLDMGRMGTLLWGGEGRLGLDAARAGFDLAEPPSRHRALPDARATAELYMEMASMIRRRAADDLPEASLAL